jgi:hypothetical protein
MDGVDTHSMHDPVPVRLLAGPHVPWKRKGHHSTSHATLMGGNYQ